MPTQTPEPGRLGRPPVTSAYDIERTSMTLMLERGFDNVSVEDLATAAGISRATFFRYFPTKADVVWRGFDRSLDRLEHALEGAPPAMETMLAIRLAIGESVLASAHNQDAWWEHFMALTASRSVGGESLDRWARWSTAVAVFVADRMGVPRGHPIPEAIAWAHQGVYVATLRAWAGTPIDTDRMVEELLSTTELVGTAMSGLLAHRD